MIRISVITIENMRNSDALNVYLSHLGPYTGLWEVAPLYIKRLIRDSYYEYSWHDFRMAARVMTYGSGVNLPGDGFFLSSDRVEDLKYADLFQYPVGPDWGIYETLDRQLERKRRLRSRYDLSFASAQEEQAQKLLDIMNDSEQVVQFFPTDEYNPFFDSQT